jgi:hypothetical protein
VVEQEWIEVAGSLSLVVQRDNAETDELRACNASESSHAGAAVAHGCLWANAVASAGRQAA